MTEKKEEKKVTQTVYEKLLFVQSNLKANKGQFNKFGGYAYRSAEDILESVKPLLAQVKALLVFEDSIETVNNRFYVKATAQFIDVESGNTITASAYAREEESKKGMDGSQVTGSSSSYARKYAMNSIFAIDDSKDSDTTNTTVNNNVCDGLKDNQVLWIVNKKGYKSAKEITKEDVEWFKDMLEKKKNADKSE